MQAQVHDDDACLDGGSASASTTMLVAPRSATLRLRARAASAFESWSVVLLLCVWAWWPLTRWARRWPAESTVRRVLAWAEVAMPWAFRVVLRPERFGGARGFAGSRGLWYACDGRIRPVTGLAPADVPNVVRPTPRRRVRRDRDGRTVGWRMAAR